MSIHIYGTLEMPLSPLGRPFNGLTSSFCLVYSNTEWFVLIIQWEEYVLCSAYGCTKNTVHAAPTAQLAHCPHRQSRGGRLGSWGSLWLPGQRGSSTRWLPIGHKLLYPLPRSRGRETLYNTRAGSTGLIHVLLFPQPSITFSLFASLPLHTLF